MNYRAFLAENWRFLAFGLLLNFASSSGQTFFISLFSAEIRAEFELSHGGFGLVYFFGTLTGALCLVWLGRKLDEVDLRRYTLATCVATSAASLLMAVAPSAAVVAAAVFMLRLTGHGLLPHIAFTSMSRYFDAGRAKAVSIAGIGEPLGMSVFPLTVVTLIGVLGWRGTWLAMAAASALVLLPLAHWLLRGQEARHRRFVEETAGRTVARDRGGRQWSRAEVLGDLRFFLMVPSALAPYVLVTGFFFHQVHLVASKGWSLTWFAACFTAFAASTVASLLASGPLVDRFGALRLLPFYLVPMAVGLVALAAFDHPAVALVFMIALGTSWGANLTIVNAMWAEVYGVAHLGAIRAMVQAVATLCTALAPPAVGMLIDVGVSMEAVAVIALAYVAAATLLAAIPAFGLRRRPVGGSRGPFG